MCSSIAFKEPSQYQQYGTESLSLNPSPTLMSPLGVRGHAIVSETMLYSVRGYASEEVGVKRAKAVEIAVGSLQCSESQANLSWREKRSFRLKEGAG